MQSCLEPLRQHCIELQLCNVVQRVLRQHCTGFSLMQCCLGSLSDNIAQDFYLRNVVPRVLRQNYAEFFSKFCLEPLGQHCTGFLPVQCCPKSIKTTLNRIFSLCKIVWSLSDIAQGFDLCNVVPRVLRQHCTKFFLIQYCMEPLRQHCIGF